MVEQILALNPGLCRLPALLPMGTVIKMPAPKKQAAPVLAGRPFVGLKK